MAAIEVDGTVIARSVRHGLAMYRVLLIIGGLLVGLLTTLFTVPLFIDWTRYRGVFEEEASRMIGRDVRVAGRVNLRFLPTPFIRFENIRITDDQTAIGEPLFRAEDFTVWLAVGALFRGVFEATEVELRKPAITLVMNEKGGGNWTALGGRTPAAAFLPSSVKLDTMRITNGLIAVFGPKGEERSRFERINGELSAEALTGPYRAVAAFASDGRTREIRLSTAAALEDGSFRIKGTVRAPEVGASLSLDGTVHDLMNRVRVDGELTARLPVPTAVGAGSSGAAPKPTVPDDATLSVIDLKSPIKADTSGIELEDMALSFEQDGQPQLASGSARIDWHDRMSMRANVQSRWLDFDRLSGAGAGTPLQIARQLVSGFDDILPTNGHATVTFEVEQATLGGDVVSRLATTLERMDGALAVKSFSVAMPGGSRLLASGVLSRRGADTGFSGDVNLRGASLVRFMAWATKPAPSTEPRRDGPFSLGSEIEINDRVLAGRSLTMHFAGSTLTGEASFSETPNRRLSLVLEGAELDVTPFLDGASAPAAALQALIGKIETVSAQSEKAVPGNRPEVVLRLRVGRLIAGNTIVRDVATDIRLANGHLAMPLLRLGRDESWSMELRGDVADFMRPGAKGAVTALVTADTPGGLTELSELLAVPFGIDPGLFRSPALLPLRVAGRLLVGGATDAGSELTVDGSVGAGRVSGSVRLDQTGATWRDRRADVSMTLENPVAANLIAQLLPDVAPGRANAASHSPTRIVLRGIGTAKQGLASFVTADTSGLTSELRGRLVVGDGLAFDGDLRVQASDIGRALTATTGRSRAALDSAAAAGAISVAMSGGKVKLETGRFAVGSVGLSGKLEVASAAGKWRVDGQVATDRLSLPLALALLTEGRARAVTGAGESDAGTWSEDSFDLALLGAFESRLRVDAGALDVAPGIAVRSARLDLVNTSGGLQIGIAQGETLGGKLAGKLQLEPLQGGARLTGKIELENGRLDQAVGTGRAAMANGSIGFGVDVDGTAPSPRGLVAALRGKGTIVLTGGQLLRFSPADVRAATEEVMAAKVETMPLALRRRLGAIGSEPQTALAMSRRTLAIEIRDSSARIAPLIIDTPEGRVSGSTTIDLDGLRLDSEWRVEARGTAGRRSKAELAPITWIWAGPLARLDSRAPRMDSEALEQDVAVRRMEREVDELERLRRQDEEAGRAEAERQRRERSELQRQGIDPTRPSPQPSNQPPPVQATSPPPWAAPAVRPESPPGASSDPLPPTSVRGPAMEPLPPASRFVRPYRADDAERKGE